MPVIVSTMPPICSDFAASSRITASTTDDESRTPRTASVARSAALTPPSATVRAPSAVVALSSARRALSCTRSAISSAARRASSSMRICRSAPCATSPTARAISSTALPTSVELVAICVADSLSAVLAPLILPTSWATAATARPLERRLARPPAKSPMPNESAEARPERTPPGAPIVMEAPLTGREL